MLKFWRYAKRFGVSALAGLALMLGMLVASSAPALAAPQGCDIYGATWINVAPVGGGSNFGQIRWCQAPHDWTDGFDGGYVMINDNVTDGYSVHLEWYDQMYNPSVQHATPSYGTTCVSSGSPTFCGSWFYQGFYGTGKVMQARLVKGGASTHAAYGPWFTIVAA